MAIEGVTVAVVVVVVVDSKMIVVFINGPAVAAGGSRPRVKNRIPRVVFRPADRGSRVDGSTAAHAASDAAHAASDAA